MAVVAKSKSLALTAAQSCLVRRSHTHSVAVHLAAFSSSWPSAACCRSSVYRPAQAYLSAYRLADTRPPQRAARTMATNVMSPPQSPETIYDFTVKDIEGRDISLSEYKGKVLLVVNVASQCGFTPQYKELAQLFNRHSDQGFVVLGFPCNQFGQQEPGDNDKIKKFAEERGAKFPMMSKVDVNGSNADPVYKYLKEKQGGMLFADIKWNFSKFLVDRSGNVVKRYGSVTTPLSIEDDVKALL